MGDNLNAQPAVDRSIIETFDRQFARLHSRLCSLVSETPDGLLYKQSQSGDSTLPSIGEGVLRSAAAVERTFGGITANLWDDPFEWTLPEQLTTSEKVVQHLGEVESLRQRAFSSFTDDSCLRLRVATPTANEETLIQLLLNTLIEANGFHSQAVLAQQSLSGISSPGFII